MTLQQWTLGRPEALLLLLALPLLAAAYAVAFAARRRALSGFGGRGAGLVARSATRQHLKAILLLVAFGALVVALAAPRIDVQERVARQRGVDLVIALDVSQSMAARDVSPDRLRASRNFIEALAQQLVGSRVALVLFAGEGVVRYPATTSPRVLAQVLDSLGRGARLQGGSSLRAGVNAAIDAFPADAEAGRGRALLVISDGEETVGGLAGLERLAERGIRAFALGMATPDGGAIPTYDVEGRQTGFLRGANGQTVTTRLQEDTLRLIAERGSGRYWRFGTDGAALRELVGELRVMETGAAFTQLAATKDERFQIPLAVALAALLAELLLSDRRPMPGPRPLRAPGVAGKRTRFGLLGERAG